VLIVTPLDLDVLLNNLEHHRIRHYSELGHRVTVVYRTMNQSRRPLDMLRDTLLFSRREWTEGNVRFVKIDPPFNYFAGLRRNAEAGTTTETPTSRRGDSLKLLLIRLLSPLSVLRDVFAGPWMAFAAWRAVRRGPWGGLAGVLVRKRGKARTFVYEDRDYEPGLVPDRFRQWYTAALERFGIRRADVTFSIGHLLSERRRDELGVTTHVVPSGVEWDRYAEARAAASPDPVLIYVGNVIDWAGLEHAIAAMPRVREQISDARLVVVGTGSPDYLAHLERLAAPLGAGVVRFLGQRDPDELPGLLAGARIGLSNAKPVLFRRYATPLKVIEYMAAGLPAITTVDTEAAAIVTRCDCGAAIPYDPDAFADAVVDLLGDEARYATLRENAIRHSRAYDWGHLLADEWTRIEACAGGKYA